MPCGPRRPTLTPTRELAMQIVAEAFRRVMWTTKTFGAWLWWRCFIIWNWNCFLPWGIITYANPNIPVAPHKPLFYKLPKWLPIFMKKQRQYFNGGEVYSPFFPNKLGCNKCICMQASPISTLVSVLQPQLFMPSLCLAHQTVIHIPLAKSTLSLILLIMWPHHRLWNLFCGWVWI